MIRQDPVPTQWIDIHKDDEGNPQVRSRLVAMETPYPSSTDPNDWNARFAETRPLEAFRQQMSMAMSGPKPASEDGELVCEFLDVSRAHFHAPIERKVLARIDS